MPTKMFVYVTAFVIGRVLTALEMTCLELNGNADLELGRKA